MKILYTATVLSHICQFHLPHMQMLQAQGWEVHVAAHDNLAVKNGLQLKYCDKFIEMPFARSPKSPDNVRAYQQMKKLLSETHYDVILCNTPMGGIVTRLAARKTRKQGTKVIYMAHGFHFYKGAPKKNWIIFYPIERFMAKFCDVIITINEEDYELAKRKFKNVRVEHIHGVGVDEKRFHPATEDEIHAMRRKEGLADDDFVLLCTGELNENKNQKTLISAAALLKEKIPNLKVLLAGNGPLEAELKAQVTREGVENIVRFLGYRRDLENVVPAVDVVVSCSHREGMPLNIVEAMLCKKPVIASINRGHRELINYGVNGILYDGVGDLVSQIYESYNSTRSISNNGLRFAALYSVSSVKKEIKAIILTVDE